MLGDTAAHAKEGIKALIPADQLGAVQAERDLATMQLAAVWLACQALQTQFASRRARMEEDPNKIPELAQEDHAEFRARFVRVHPDVILIDAKEPRKKFVEKLNRDYLVNGMVPYYTMSEVRTRADTIVQKSGLTKNAEDLLTVSKADEPEAVTDVHVLMNRIHAFFMALDYLNICSYSRAAGPLDYLQQLEQFRIECPSLPFVMMADNLIRKKAFRLQAEQRDKYNSYEAALKEVLTNHKYLWNDARTKALLSRVDHRRDHETAQPDRSVADHVDKPSSPKAAKRKQKLERMREELAKAKNSTKKADGGPPPLRHPRALWGLPGLARWDQAKVNIGNQLMQLIVSMAQLAAENGALWSIENPLGSYLWQMPPVKQLCAQGAIRLELDMCRFGSDHLKPTAIVATAPLHTLAQRCDHPTRPHHHDPLVGFEMVNGKKQFKTKRAQVYPVELCFQWATAFTRQADPNERTFTMVIPASERKRPLGQKVPWHGHRQEVTGAKALAAGYQLKRSVLPPLLEVEYEPGQAVRVALELVHPFSRAPELDPDLQEALALTAHHSAWLRDHRCRALTFWEHRAHALLPETDQILGKVYDPWLRALLRGTADDQPIQLGKCTHIALWREMAQAARSVDCHLVDQLLMGMPIVGDIDRSHRWEPFDKGQETLDVHDLQKRAWEFSAKVIRNLAKCEVTENTQKVWDATMEDVAEGVTLGPFFTKEEVTQIVGSPWIPTQRFEVVQKNKVRGVDSATTNGINMATKITEKLDLPSTDVNVAAIRWLRSHAGHRSLAGWVLDERKAYRQEDPDSYQGRGGLFVVVAVAMFSSLAGLLMGLDIGYIAGIKTMDSFAEGLLHEDKLKDTQDSLITMIFGVGAAVAAFPPVMDLCVSFLGRKGAVIAGGAIFCLGSGLQALACNMTMMLMGRVIAGFSVGLLSGNAPVYTSEIAPPKLRGALVTGFQFAITVGIMLAFLLALVLEDVEKPYAGLHQLMAGFRIPSFLIRALKDVRVELAQILQEHEAESATHTSWGEFLSGDNLKLLGIGVSIQLLQQLCGMNAFMYDGPLIFNKLFGSEHAGRLFTLVSGVVNIFATIPGLFLVDRYGRTLLMKWSAIGISDCFSFRHIPCLSYSKQEFP
eukprot:g4332.t1